MSLEVCHETQLTNLQRDDLNGLLDRFAVAPSGKPPLGGRGAVDRFALLCSGRVVAGAEASTTPARILEQFKEDRLEERHGWIKEHGAISAVVLHGPNARSVSKELRTNLGRRSPADELVIHLQHALGFGVVKFELTSLGRGHLDRLVKDYGINVVESFFGKEPPTPERLERAREAARYLMQKELEELPDYNTYKYDISPLSKTELLAQPTWRALDRFKRIP